MSRIEFERDEPITLPPIKKVHAFCDVCPEDRISFMRMVSGRIGFVMGSASAECDVFLTTGIARQFAKAILELCDQVEDTEDTEDKGFSF